MASTGSSGAHTHTYSAVAGAVGPAGPPGVQGPPGPAGPPGTAADLTTLTARVATLEESMANVVLSITKLGGTVTPPVPAPIEPAPVPSGTSVTVSSIAALLSALANNSLDEIVVANGTYHVSTAGSQASDSLWIGAKFAGRTRPIVVRAATSGSATFDGGGAAYFGGISFQAGAHHQTWQGFRFASGTPTQTGVIVFGGYVGSPGAHHITLRDITLPSSIVSASTGATDHGVYFSEAAGGPHDILIDGLTVDGAGGLDTALHFYHSDPGNPNVWNVTVRNLTVSGTDQAIMIWDDTIVNLLIEDATITGATQRAVRYEGGQVTLRRVVSTGSGGFYSSKGATPPGVTFDTCSLA